MEKDEIPGGLEQVANSSLIKVLSPDQAVPQNLLAFYVKKTDGDQQKQVNNIVDEVVDGADTNLKVTEEKNHVFKVVHRYNPQLIGLHEQNDIYNES